MISSTNGMFYNSVQIRLHYMNVSASKHVQNTNFSKRILTRNV